MCYFISNIRYGLYKGSKIKNCPRHAVIGLNQRFLHNYTYEKKNFWKKLFFGSFTPFFVPKWPFLPKITHFINFLVFNFLNKCKMNILWNTKYLWRKTKRKIMKKKFFWPIWTHFCVKNGRFQGVGSTAHFFGHVIKFAWTYMIWMCFGFIERNLKKFLKIL